MLSLAEYSLNGGIIRSFFYTKYASIKIQFVNLQQFIINILGRLMKELSFFLAMAGLLLSGCSHDDFSAQTDELAKQE